MPSGKPPWTRDQFVDFLVDRPLGQIVLCNVLDGYDADLFSKEIVREYFKFWIMLCNELKYPGIRSIVRATGQLTKSEWPGHPAGLPANVPAFQFACTRRPGPAQSEARTLTVVKPTDLDYFVDPNDDNVKALELPICTGSDWTDDIVKKLRSLRPRKRKFDAAADGQIGKDVLWQSTESEFAGAVGAQGHDLADRARDFLGLVGHRPGEVLVSLHFANNTIDTADAGRPTFMDARGHKRFQAVARLKEAAPCGVGMDRGPKRIFGPGTQARWAA